MELVAVLLPVFVLVGFVVLVGVAIALADIIASGADIVVVPEETWRFHPFLSAAYPYRETPRYGPAVAVFAKIPITVLPRPAGVYSADRFHTTGSDHRGVVARVGPCGPAEPD